MIALNFYFSVNFRERATPCRGADKYLMQEAKKLNKK